jgi:hypothetical protein
MFAVAMTLRPIGSGKTIAPTSKRFGQPVATD